MGEVLAGDEVGGVGPRGGGELRVELERRQARVGALAVEQAELGRRDRAERRGRRGERLVGAGGAGADAVAALTVRRAG